MALNIIEIRRRDTLRRMNIPEGILRRFLAAEGYTLGTEEQNTLAVMKIVGEERIANSVSSECTFELLDEIKSSTEYDYDKIIHTRDNEAFAAFKQKMEERAKRYYAAAQTVTPFDQSREEFVSGILLHIALEYEEATGIADENMAAWGLDDTDFEFSQDRGQPRRSGNNFFRGKVERCIQPYIDADYQACQEHCAQQDIIFEKVGSENYRLYHLAHPEFRNSFQYSSRRDLSPASLTSHLKRYAHELALYQNILHDLEHQYGFMVVCEDNGILLEHEGLKSPLTLFETVKRDATGKETIATSTNIIERLNKRIQPLRGAQQQRLNVLAQLEEGGFKIEYLPGDKDVRELVITPNYDVPTAKFPIYGALGLIPQAFDKETSAWLQQIRRQPKPTVALERPAESPAAQALEDSVIAPTRPGTSVIIPRRSRDYYFVVDGSALAPHLSTPRTNGSNWLDLIHIISRFSNMKAVVIPSVIADFELRGKAPKLINDVWQLVTLDKNMTEKLWYNAVNRFLNKFTRVFIDPDGGVTVRQEGEPKLLIVESNNQTTFYDYLFSQQEEAKQAGIPFAGQLKQIRENEAKDFGEDCMLEFAYSPYCDGPAIFLTNDGVFAHQCKMDTFTPSRDRIICTSTGLGVSTITPERLIYTLDDALGDTLTQLINNPPYGGTEKNTNATRIIAAIERHTPEANFTVRPRVVLGRNLDGTFLKHPAFVIEDGAQAWIAENQRQHHGKAPTADRRPRL